MTVLLYRHIPKTFIILTYFLQNPFISSLAERDISMLKSLFHLRAQNLRIQSANCSLSSIP